jgi:uncharacterized protein YjiS (DUF1127 family)
MAMMVTTALPARRRRRDRADALLAQLRQWRARVRGRQLLRDFDDRMLRDLGICRAEAIREARKRFWRE